VSRESEQPTATVTEMLEDCRRFETAAGPETILP